MDVVKMLAELRQEREHIEEAILTLERLARGRGRRRGRPPSWMTEIKRRGRPPGSKNKPKTESKSASAKSVVTAA
jgi:DNA invertase Pin-like site-specific DNA recombinase